jgi:hypothetical protein
MVHHCRNAQTACSEFSFTAIDRAESGLLYCLQRECNFSEDEDSFFEGFAIKYEDSARCYENAHNRQQCLDFRNAALWKYAGVVYDQVDTEDHRNIAIRVRGRGEELLRVKRWTDRAVAHETPAETFEATTPPAVITLLRAEIALKYRTTLAFYEVYHAIATLPTLWDVKYSGPTSEATARSADYLVHTLEYTQRALDCNEASEGGLYSLWQLCARCMRFAAEEVNRGNADRWARTGMSFAGVAELLAPILRALNAMPVAIAAPEVADVRQRLFDFFELLMPVTAGEAFDADIPRLENLVRAIAFRYKRVTSGWIPEQNAIQRYAQAADKVNVDQSPAHPYIKQCWLSAAEQLRLAAVVTTDEECALFKQRSVLQRKLAEGPLAAAADYFARGHRTTVMQVKQLWLRAAKAQLEATVPLMERCLQANSKSIAQERRFASRLAEAATCCEMVSAGPRPGQPAVLYRLGEAELQLRVTLVEGGGGVARHTLLASMHSCGRLLRWCQHVQIASSVLTPPGAPVVSAEARLAAQRSVEARFDRAIKLCEILALLSRVCATADATSCAAVAAQNVKPWFEQLRDSVLTGEPSSLEILPHLQYWRKAAVAHLAGDPEACLAWCAVVQLLCEDTRWTRARMEMLARLVSMGGEGAASELTLQLPQMSDDYSIAPQYSVQLDAAVHALVEHQRQLELRCSAEANPDAQKCTEAAAAQFMHCADYIGRVITSASIVDQKPVTDPTIDLERGARARRAGGWYAAAARAATESQREVYTALLKAADYSQEPDLRGLVSVWRFGCSDEKLSVATKTAERFARAAEALQTGDRELYEMWLKAAEATAHQVKRRSVVGADDAPAHAEALAEAAQIRHNAVGVRKTAGCQD